MELEREMCEENRYKLLEDHCLRSRHQEVQSQRGKPSCQGGPAKTRGPTGGKTGGGVGDLRARGETSSR